MASTVASDLLFGSRCCHSGHRLYDVSAIFLYASHCGNDVLSLLILYVRRTPRYYDKARYDIITAHVPIDSVLWSTIKLIRVFISLTTEMLDREYLKRLQLFIFVHLTPLAILESPKSLKDRKTLVSEEAMGLWVPTFTHRSYNPNNGENYETQEYVGDSIMGSTFAYALTTLYPTISPEALTDLKNAKVWKEEQAKLSDQIGLARFLRTNLPISVSDKEDLLEAVFGTLKRLGNTLYGIPGTGDVLCSNLMVTLYRLNEFVLDVTKIKAPANQLKEIGDKLKWWKGKTGSVEEFGIPRPLNDRYGKRTGFELVFTLTPKAIRWLQAHGKSIVDHGVIARQTRDKKKEVEAAAIQEALINLKKYYQIDWVAAAEMSKLITYNDPVLYARMEQDSVIELELEKFDSKYRDGEYYQLIGERKDGVRRILLTASKDPALGKINERREIVNYYKNNGPQKPSKIIRLIPQ